MPFMVIYRTSDGGSCYEQADAIDEAALLVERLRNKDGLDEIRIYRMEEISFAFRPYYKVELGLAERQSAPPSAVDRGGARRGPPAAEPMVEPSRASRGGPAPPHRGRRWSRRPPRPSTRAAGHLRRRSDDETASANGRRGLFGR